MSSRYKRALGIIVGVAITAAQEGADQQVQNHNINNGSGDEDGDFYFFGLINKLADFGG